MALPVIAQLEQQMEKLKIEKRTVKIEPLVKKGLLILFTGCSANILSKEGNEKYLINIHGTPSTKAYPFYQNI